MGTERDHYQLATRINSFLRNGVDLPTAIRAMARVPGIVCLEVNYPQHLLQVSETDLVSLLSETGLSLSAINLRFEGKQFANGAFTSPDAATRARAIEIACDAVDLASRHGVGHVVLWMADDGFDYPFQVDVASLWNDEIEAFRRVADHRPEIRVSVEYKPSDPRRVALIRGMGDALLAVRDVARDNFGVTLDFCHALMAGEHPAAVAAMALRDSRLFGVHLNDGYGPADDGLAVGSVHPWEMMELLIALDQGQYDGTLYFDTFPVREDPAIECAFNVETVRRYERAIDRLDSGALAEARRSHDALLARSIVTAAMMAEGAGT